MCICESWDIHVHYIIENPNELTNAIDLRGHDLRAHDFITTLFWQISYIYVVVRKLIYAYGSNLK